MTGGKKRKRERETETQTATSFSHGGRETLTYSASLSVKKNYFIEQTSVAVWSTQVGLYGGPEVQKKKKKTLLDHFSQSSHQC